MNVPTRSKFALVRVAALAALAWPAVQAHAQTLHVLRPINGAIVRETVPVRIAPGDLPADGYVGITIDGKFRTARVLPASKHEAVYDWDTKASYITPEDPNTQQFVADGPHTLTVKLYNTSGKSLGEQTINVKVANKINVPSQGIKLAYRWNPDLQQRYTRRTEADTVADGATGANQTLQSSILRFTRTVEDTTGGDYLIRDRILPGGVLITHGQPQAIDALYNIKSKYRTVDTRGNVLGSMAPLSLGSHYGFSIPVLSARRVAVGDTWQAPVEVSLDWASIKPATVNAESRLEGFEWQSGYPVAKIRESYTGPITFTPATGAVSASVGAAYGASSASGASATNSGSVTIPTLNYERIVYFAYNSGRLVRTETTLTLTVDNTQLASLGFAGVSTGNAGGYGGQGGGYSSPDNSDTSLPQGAGQPPAYVPSPTRYAPTPSAGAYPSQQGGYQGQAPGGYQGQASGGYQGQAVPQSTTTNLKVTDITAQG